jgi:hypothetical protein
MYPWMEKMIGGSRGKEARQVNRLIALCMWWNGQHNRYQLLY